MVSMSEKVSLGWNDFQINLNTTVEAQLNSKDFTDVTLVSADGQQSAHRIVLSAGSPLLAKLLTSLPPNPVLYFWDLQASLLSSLVDFLYKGKVEVATSDLAAFLALADKLKVRGLTGSVLKEEPEESVAEVNEEDQDVAELKEIEETRDQEQPEICGRTVEIQSRKLKSDFLWKYFQDDTSNAGSKVNCRLCGVKVKLGKEGMMRKHMEKQHTGEWAVALAEKVEKESLETAAEETFSAAEEDRMSKTVPLPIWMQGKTIPQSRSNSTLGAAPEGVAQQSPVKRLGLRMGKTGRKKRGRKADSQLWNFFQRSSADLLVAICNRCERKVRRGKEGSSLRKLGNTGMVAHLKSSHPEDLPLLQRMREGAKPVEAAFAEAKKDSARSDQLWFYFDRLESGRAACQVGECPVELDGEDSLLKEHLDTHQPAV